MPPAVPAAAARDSREPTPRAVWAEAVVRLRHRQIREQADIDDEKAAHQQRVAVLAEVHAREMARARDGARERSR